MATNITFNHYNTGRTNDSATIVDLPIRGRATGDANGSISQNSIVTWADKIDWGEFTLKIAQSTDSPSADVSNSFRSFINALQANFDYLYSKLNTQQTVYIVTFNGNGGTINGDSVRTVNGGDAVGALPSVTRNGYNLVGWYNDISGGSAITASTVINSNITFYARWIKVYTVTFNGNGGSVSGATSRTVNAGSQIGSLPNVTRNGYNLVGWYTDMSGGNTVTSSTVVNNDITIYAQWVKLCTVTFKGNGGTVNGSTTRTVTEGSQIGALPTATRSGWDLLGWFTEISGGNSVTSSTIVNDNITIYAQWSEQELILASIEWVSTTISSVQGNSPSYPNIKLTYSNGSTNIISASTSGVSISPNITSSSNTGTYNVTATYQGKTTTNTLSYTVEPQPVTQYTVTFNGNGGSVSGSTTRTVNAGAQIGTLPTVTRSGYNLTGWYTDSTGGTAVTASTTVNSNITIYAQWSEQQSDSYWFSIGTTAITSSNYTTVNDAEQVDSYPSETMYSPSSRTYVYILVENSKTVTYIEPTLNAPIDASVLDNIGIPGYKVYKSDIKLYGQVKIKIS